MLIQTLFFFLIMKTKMFLVRCLNPDFLAKVCASLCRACYSGSADRAVLHIKISGDRFEAQKDTLIGEKQRGRDSVAVKAALEEEF